MADNFTIIFCFLFSERGLSFDDVGGFVVIIAIISFGNLSDDFPDHIINPFNNIFRGQ